MTLLLRTESHGVLESGFWGPFTQLSRIGEYSFSTRHMCDVAKHFADNSNALESRILSYDLNKFEDREGLERCFDELDKKQGEISVEDDVNLNSDGEIVPVRILEDEKSISIGKYRISSIEFGRMAIYLAEGGFMGWLDDNSPAFAAQTIEAIKNSKREFYREVREEYSR